MILRVNVTNFREMVACRAKVFLTKARLNSIAFGHHFGNKLKKEQEGWEKEEGRGGEGKIEPVVLHPGIIFWLVPTLCLSHHSRSLQTIRRII